MDKAENVSDRLVDWESFGFRGRGEAMTRIMAKLARCEGGAVLGIAVLTAWLPPLADEAQEDTGDGQHIA